MSGERRARTGDAMEPQGRTPWAVRALYAVARSLLWFHLKVFYGARAVRRVSVAEIQGLHGAVVVANHCCMLDSALVAETFPHRRLRFLSLAENGRHPVYGPLVRGLGAIFVSDTLAGTRRMLAEVAGALAQGDFLAVFPEGHLRPYEEELQPFQPGAFRMAVDRDVPVVVATLVPRHRPCLNVLRAKPAFDVVVGPVLHGDPTLKGRAAAQELMGRARTAMEAELAR